MKRWVCPRCGQGALAPERPRRDDSRRYCLACSAKTGRLVERSCPSLDQQRAASKEKAAAKSLQRRAKEKAAERERRSIGGFDLDAEARRLWQLPTLRDARARNRRPARQPVPPLSIHRTAKKHRTRTSGRAWLSGSGAHLTLGTEPGEALEALLHELMHGCGYPHGQQFWSFLRSAAKEAWPEARFDFAEARDGWRTDLAITKGIRGWLAEKEKS